MLASLFIQEASAQTKDGFYIGLNMGVSNEQPHDHFVNVAPEIGYQFSDRWSAGLRTTFGTSSSTCITVAPYAQFSFLKFGKWKVFSEATLQYWIQDKGYDTYAESTSDIEAGLTAGASYSISKHVSLRMHYLFLGYSDVEYTNTGAAVLGGGNFILDGCWRRFSIGLQYNF